MDYSRWAEMQQHPTNPTPSTDPYAQFYNAQQSSSYTHYPHQPQNLNSNLSYPQTSLNHHEIPSTQYDTGLNAALQPPGVDSYASMSSFPPTHLGYEAPAAVGHSHQPAQVGAMAAAAAAYYQDPIAITQNLAVTDAIRQFGADPVGYAAACIKPTTGMEPLVVANPNPIFQTNPSVRPPGIGHWKRGPKKTKFVHSVWCEVCKIDCNSKDVLDRHKLGKKHKRNLEKLEESKEDANAPASAAAPAAKNPAIGPKEKRTEKGKAISVEQTRKKVAMPVPVEDLETKRQKLMEGGAAAYAVRVCTICNVACNSQTVFNFHLSGQKHAAMVEKLAAGIPAA